MPHMGRRKFSMGGKLHGRNMLISEYIFVICVALLGSKEIFRIDNSNDSIEQMGRKQVSSHMQVVKKFFEDLRCCKCGWTDEQTTKMMRLTMPLVHFLFPAEEKKEPGTTNSDDFYEEEEQESFKSNPVLTALAEGRVPEVKPNYEYFSQLLALQSSITIRPKACEIIVASSEVEIRGEFAYDSNNQQLDPVSFPHLNKYANCDDGPHVLTKDDVLLHEYTRSLDRSTSACVKTVTRRWQKDAPALYESLDLPTRDEECLLLEMCTTIELHEEAKFPTGSEITGFVEVAITRPGLQNHRWKCITKLTRPDELQCDERAPKVYTNDSGIHRKGCSDARNECDCFMRPRQDISVPFPAVEWASILSTAVHYPDLEHQRKKDRRNKMGDKKLDMERAGSKRKRSEDEGDAAAWARREPTGSDLICKVAMYQELWSCAPDSTRWSRQAIIFWRFSTTNQWYKYNPVFRPSGTTWRWLTVNDPMSRYHQQKALVYPSSSVSSVPRDAVMSPTPSVSQQITAAMSETFNQAWDNGVSLGPVPPSNSSMSLFDSFPGGLATPPPTASVHGSYSTSAGSFDTASSVGNFLPPSCGADSQTGSLSHSQTTYFDATTPSCAGSAAVTTFADVKPIPSSVNPYMAAAGTAPLDLSSQLVYDSTPNPSTSSSSSNNNNGATLETWDMSAALDSWTGTASTAPSSTAASSDWAAAAVGVSSHHAAPKLDTTGMWNPVHWGHHSTATSASSAVPQPPPPPQQQQPPTMARDASPRAMKRRRTETLDPHVAVTAGW